MSISRIIVGFALLILPLTLLAQKATLDSATSAAAANQETSPKLDHFDPDLVDKSLNPCDDFYKYACNKWIAANPIPADQVYWSTGGGNGIGGNPIIASVLVEVVARVQRLIDQIRIEVIEFRGAFLVGRSG